MNKVLLCLLAAIVLTLGCLPTGMYGGQNMWGGGGYGPVSSAPQPMPQYAPPPAPMPQPVASNIVAPSSTWRRPFVRSNDIGVNASDDPSARGAMMAELEVYGTTCAFKVSVGNQNSHPNADGRPITLLMENGVVEQVIPPACPDGIPCGNVIHVTIPLFRGTIVHTTWQNLHQPVRGTGTYGTHIFPLGLRPGSNFPLMGDTCRDD